MTWEKLMDLIRYENKDKVIEKGRWVNDEKTKTRMYTNSKKIIERNESQ
jgi:hypothetical protein